MAMMTIRIVQRPIGEAPEWVRDAWIGVSLPLALERPRRWPTLGVLNGPHGVVSQIWAMLTGKAVKVTGYVVDANSAIDVLAGTRPDAAGWWREHALELLDRKRCFIFDLNACEQEQ